VIGKSSRVFRAVGLADFARAEKGPARKLMPPEQSVRLTWFQSGL
jgi:hypothetical protein